MTDIDYLINRFHELFRRQDVQRQLGQLQLHEQMDQDHEPPAEDEPEVAPRAVAVLS